MAEALHADGAPATGDGAGELARGRRAAERLRWAEAFESLSRADQAMSLPAQDHELLATAAYLMGEVAGCLHALQRAGEAYAAAGDVARAARCLFWLGFVLLMQGEPSQAGGWMARAARLLDDETGEYAERGLLLLPQVYQAAADGDHARAEALAADVAEIGHRSGDAEVLSLALHEQGRAMVRQGLVGQGMALLDESMTAVVGGEAAPYVAGSLYCSMIDACREVADIRRAHEWTGALTEWCDEQPDMFTFSGQCLAHRADIMHLHGQWTEAIAEANRACERFDHAADQHAAGMAWYRLAEVYRGQGALTAAEDAYRRASEWGRDPQPGLALLWLGTGRADAARTAIERAVAEQTDPLGRASMLPALVEVALAVGDVDAARTAATKLSAVADEYGTDLLRAESDRAVGAVQLADGEARDALATLRRAWRLCQELDVPYEAARVRVLIGQACRALGDEESAALELDSAQRAFAQLGAAADLALVDELTRPDTDAAATHGLSARELQVLRLLAAGKTNRAIASDLVVAPRTVDRHVSNIFAKLGVSSRAAATAFAYEQRLVRRDDGVGSPG